MTMHFSNDTVNACYCWFALRVSRLSKSFCFSAIRNSQQNQITARMCSIFTMAIFDSIQFVIVVIFGFVVSFNCSCVVVIPFVDTNKMYVNWKAGRKETISMFSS